MTRTSRFKQGFAFSAASSVKRLLGLALGCSIGLSAFAAGPSSTKAHTRPDGGFGKLPMSFEQNLGQTDRQVQFLSRGTGYSLFLTHNEAVLALQAGRPGQTSAVRSTIRMQILGANEDATIQGQDGLTGTANYFEGTDKSQWKTAIPTYKRVSYKGIYPGIDVVYYGNQRELEYDFVVAPGANPERIALGFTGASPRIDTRTGDLVLAASAGETRFRAPVVYQRYGSKNVPIAGTYTLTEGQVHFKLGRYDHSRELVIDPVLNYMTYLGGTADDQIHGMTVDASGNVIVVGTTYSTDFPLKNAYSSTPPFDSRTPTMFISKFNATGTALIYSTYLGLSTNGNAIAVDPAGNAYAFGTTSDSNYPVTPGAYQTICGANFNQSTGARISGCSYTSVSGNNSTVITKLSPDGQKILYSTYLSGSNGNVATAIAVNAAGEAYVTGVTNFSCTSGGPAYFCFPQTANAADTSGGSYDTEAFFTKLNAQGTALVYSTVIANHNPVGHSVSGIQPTAIALDTAGNAYVTGYMDANWFITTTPGAYLTTKPNGGATLPAFVYKYNPAGTAATSLVYGTYLSGSGRSNDLPHGIAVDASNSAVVTGFTDSCTFPTTAGSFSTVPNGDASANSCSGGFLTKINPAGSGLVWSTWTSNLGANGRVSDTNDALALAADGSIYVAADNNGTALIPTVNPIFTQLESHFTSIKHFTADGKSLVFSSAIGGTTDATSLPVAVALDPAGNIYIAGNTNSTSWPTTAGAVQKTNAGGTYDSYVVKLLPTAPSTTALTVPAGVTAGQSVKLSAKVAGPTGTTTIPTGTVTFLSGANPLGSGTLDGTGTATYTAPSLNGTTYVLTASYGGDSTFSPSVSAAQNLVVAPATAVVTLNAPATALVGASVTLSATVTGSGATPTGTVTFKDGTAILNMATLASGSASFSTTTLSAGTHSITANYSGDSVFGAAVSTGTNVTINVPASISFAAAPASLTIVRGATGSVVITGTAVGGYTGSATFACGTLPASANCSFSPASLSFTANSASQSTTLTLSTSTTTTASIKRPGSYRTEVLAALLMMPIGLLYRLRRCRSASLLGLVAVVSLGLCGLGGCSSGSSAPKTTTTTTTTAAGTYTVPVTVTTAQGNVSLNVPLVVQ